MKKYKTASFWEGLAERSISTTAQAALGALGTTSLLTEVDWRVVTGTAALAGLASVLKAFAFPDVTDTSVATYEPRHSVTIDE